MTGVIAFLGTATAALRTAAPWVLAAAALLAFLAWLERTRRVSAFGAVSRFARRVLDPVLVPVDRIVLRLGGHRQMAPWWWLFAVLLVGTGLIAMLGLVRTELAMMQYAAGRGTLGIVWLAVGWVLSLLQLALLVRVVLSWVGGLYSRLGRLAVSATEWMLAPLRRIIPPVGRVDITPLVAWFALALVEGWVLRGL